MIGFSRNSLPIEKKKNELALDIILIIAERTDEENINNGTVYLYEYQNLMPVQNGFSLVANAVQKIPWKQYGLSLNKPEARSLTSTTEFKIQSRYPIDIYLVITYKML